MLDALFCRQCGADVHEGAINAQFCSGCGNQMLPDALFCRHCGQAKKKDGDQAKLKKWAVKFESSEMHRYTEADMYEKFGLKDVGAGTTLVHKDRGKGTVIMEFFDDIKASPGGCTCPNACAFVHANDGAQVQNTHSSKMAQQLRQKESTSCFDSSLTSSRNMPR